ncbi:MAG TPA: tripartite tricarboxylate transporter substrate binding protein [Usitatibacter sp.]|nr:tripartite tricarboxylate transporter substrate binding protein [Usitatibacter sp.]
MTTARLFLASIALLALSTTLLGEGRYPEKPIRLVVPFPPGGGTDILSRAISHSMSAATGWTFVVDNRPGAGGNIGLDAAAHSPPDGYTIAMGQTANLAVNPSLYAKMTFDPVKDFAPVALLSSQPLILVVSEKSPYRSLEELVDAAKAKPGALNMGSAGNGTIGHVGGELFQRRAGIRFAHIPYKGAGPAVTDLMGGSIDVYFGNSQSVGGLVNAGKLRAIAVTSPKRTPAFPNVPTIAESGYPGFEAATWSGLVAPAGTPKAIVDQLNAAAIKALHAPEMAKKLEEDGSTPLGGSPEDFARFIRAEEQKWGAAVRGAGIKLD